MATQAIKDLLLEAGPFARLSAMEQRTRLVIYYQSWFLSDYRIDTVNNIRATQRLTTHSKVMGSAVGVVLQAILLEASGIEPGSRGLLDVEVDQADTSQEEAVQSTTPQVDLRATSGVDHQDDILVSPTLGSDPAVTSEPAPGAPKSRSKRAK